MQEQPRYVPIVREPDLTRIAAATRAVLAEFDRLRELTGHRPDILARLYAARAVAADDDHGAARGLVVQADELRWAELDQLVRLAEAQLEPGRHADVGTWHQDCPDCQAVLAIGRIRARHRYRSVSPRSPPPPAAGQRGGGRPGGGRPGGGQPGGGQPGGGQPGAGQPGTPRRGTPQRGTLQRGTPGAGLLSAAGCPAPGGRVTPGRSAP
jgi:hypothetical protein